jgi:hypothetical protein
VESHEVAGDLVADRQREDVVVATAALERSVDRATAGVETRRVARRPRPSTMRQSS